LAFRLQYLDNAILWTALALVALPLSSNASGTGPATRAARTTIFWLCLNVIINMGEPIDSLEALLLGVVEQVYTGPDASPHDNIRKQGGRASTGTSWNPNQSASLVYTAEAHSQQDNIWRLNERHSLDELVHTVQGRRYAYWGTYRPWHTRKALIYGDFFFFFSATFDVFFFELPSLAEPATSSSLAGRAVFGFFFGRFLLLDPAVPSSPGDNARLSRSSPTRPATACIRVAVLYRGAEEKVGKTVVALGPKACLPAEAFWT
jgi:hypothetical protein